MCIDEANIWGTTVVCAHTTHCTCCKWQLTVTQLTRAYYTGNRYMIILCTCNLVEKFVDFFLNRDTRKFYTFEISHFFTHENFPFYNWYNQFMNTHIPYSYRWFSGLCIKLISSPDLQQRLHLELRTIQVYT